MVYLSTRLFLRPSYVVLGLALLTAVPAHAADNSAAASEERLRKDVFYLASDELEGRGPTTKGIDKAADYIAAEFKKAGLRPGGGDGTYFQPFPYPANVLDEPARLTLRGPKGQEIVLKQGDQFNPMGLGRAGKLTALVVFAGYGITSVAAKYDDYDGIDATDKVVVVLRDAPHCANNEETAARLKAAASFTRKMANAEKHKAAAVLFVNDAETARGDDDLLDFNFTALGRIAQESNRPAFHVHRSVLQTMLTATGAADLADLERRIDKDLEPQSKELIGWTAGLEVKAHKGALTLKNVIGVLEGAGPLAKETVVVGAHYDHLGYGGAGGSLVKTIKKPIIHPGADDNASGSAAVMELARRSGAAPDRIGRRVVFMAFSGEEIGLEGSKYYCEHPLFPLEETAAMFNLDMVGRLRPDEKSHKENVLVEGAGTGKNFADLIDAVNRKYDFNLSKRSETLPANSDHFSFYKKRIPVLFFWTGNHSDYHKPTDTADKVNVAGMRKVVDLSADVVSALATEAKRPEYQAVKVSSAKRSDGPTLRVMPNYTDDGDGLLLDGVADDGPAAKAGLKAGDR
ncbi:MAG TPA: aminopeptidase, partial [Planctomycetales bacterium]|nr:aminopeptidase [Planctomycetales bacterium]